jgi:spore maturation protein CgeB
VTRTVEQSRTLKPTQHHRLRFVFIGLSITSSWGNGHATTYRGLVRELVRRGHEVLFLEHDKPWYAANRDLPNPPFGRTELYESIADLKDRFAADVRDADVVIVGSYVPHGVSVGQWVTRTAGGLTAFYDIDTPVTLAKLRQQDYEYLSPELIPRYDIYFSFTGGPTLQYIERELGARRALPLYCSVDPQLYYPRECEARWDLGYLGTYSADRQPTVQSLLIEPAQAWRGGRFVVAGPQYPPTILWPSNVKRIMHLPPAEHRDFYASQRFTLNVTRGDMIRAGYSPSVRLFEAAACGVPIISDWWQGLDSFFEIGSEILVARSSDHVLQILREMDELHRMKIADRARQRVLSAHTAAHRAAELETHVLSALAVARTIDPPSPFPGTPGEGWGGGLANKSSQLNLDK